MATRVPPLIPPHPSKLNTSTIIGDDSEEYHRLMSGKTHLTSKGYMFGRDDANRRLLGQSLKDHSEYMRGSFVVTALVIIVIELVLLAWPITATSLWTLQAAVTWVWGFYIFRIGLLSYVVLTSSSLAIEKMWGMGHYTWTEFYRVYGTFAPSSALLGWSTLAFYAGCVLGGIATVVSAAIYSVYSSKILWGLALGIGVISTIESFVAPFV